MTTEATSDERTSRTNRWLSPVQANS